MTVNLSLINSPYSVASNGEPEKQEEITQSLELRVLYLSLQIIIYHYIWSRGSLSLPHIVMFYIVYQMSGQVIKQQLSVRYINCLTFKYKLIENPYINYWHTILPWSWNEVLEALIYNVVETDITVTIHSAHSWQDSVELWYL